MKTDINLTKESMDFSLQEYFRIEKRRATLLRRLTFIEKELDGLDKQQETSYKRFRNELIGCIKSKN